MKLNRRIRTFLYNDQRFSDTELDLLHTPALQRLYDLHQLGFTDRVYVDASHGRLHHVLGVVEQTGKLLKAIERNLLSKPDEELPFTGEPESSAPTKRQIAELVRNRLAAARCMAFLHDLTHAPYGHTLEDEIHLVS